MTTAGVMFVDTARLLAAHLTSHQLPEPASLTVRRSEVTAQVHSLTAAGVVAELLTWADTLSTVTVTVTVKAWRTPDGDNVHLSITSILTGPVGAVPLYVYGGIGDAPVLFADLAPGEYRDVSLGQLRTWAAGGSDTSWGAA